MKVIKCKSARLMGISTKIEGAVSLGSNISELRLNLRSAEKAIRKSYNKHTLK